MASKKSDPFNRGLEIFLEWGPAMVTPIEDRLKKVFPKLSAKAIVKLIGEYQDIRAAASGIVIDQLETHQSEETGRSRVEAIDPRVSADNASMLYAQARVNAWRDGYA